MYQRSIFQLLVPFSIHRIELEQWTFDPESTLIGKGRFGQVFAEAIYILMIEGIGPHGVVVMKACIQLFEQPVVERLAGPALVFLAQTKCNLIEIGPVQVVGVQVIEHILIRSIL